MQRKSEDYRGRHQRQHQAQADQGAKEGAAAILMTIMVMNASQHAPQAAIMEAREGRHEGWKDKYNKKGGGTTNLEKLKSKP
jgi:hypothetical protein